MRRIRHSGDRAKRGSPESITTVREYGFRAGRDAPSRNDKSRRDFTAALAAAVAVPLLAPLKTRAQETGRIYRLGSLQQGARNALQHTAFYNELRRLGFVDGQNLSVDPHGYGLQVGQLVEHASQIVKDQIDVILCAGDAAIRAAQQATKTTPILGLTDDMVGSGLVKSLPKPEGNTTGVSILATELDGKRQEILIEAVPGIHHMATLADGNTTSPQQLDKLRDAARARGVELSIYTVTAPEELANVIEDAKSKGVAALNALATPLIFNNRGIILERTTALRLPAIYQWPEMSEEGGLIGYGPRIVDIYRDMLTRQLVKLLRGTKPGDIPVEQPTKFELVINLKTAQAIGHDVPAGLVLRADKVIE
jgi:putative ABC transport system substrate-binding protein